MNIQTMAYNLKRDQKIKNNPLSWVRLATEPKCDIDQFDKMVVHKGYAMGSDGYRIHGHKLPADQAANLEGKVIDENGNVLDIDSKPDKLPPVVYLFPMLVADEYPLTDTFDLSKCVVEKSERTGKYLFKLELFGEQCLFNKKFIEQALNGRQSVNVCANAEFDAQSAVRFMLSDTETAVVMPVHIEV